MKSKEQILVKQIERLCEKQYRKGFQQGFNACEKKLLTKKQVDNFRLKGMDENYSRVIDPHTGRKQDPIDRLIGEIAMPGMTELELLFYSVKK